MNEDPNKTPKQSWKCSVLKSAIPPLQSKTKKAQRKKRNKERSITDKIKRK